MWEPSSSTPAGIGFVVFVPAEEGGEPPPPCLRKGRWLHSHLHVPDDFMRAFVARKTYICQLELLAAVAVYYSLPAVFAGRQVIHFIDNSPALVAGLAKNAAGAEDSAKVVHSFWALASALQIDAWFEYVASKANVADWPSRDDCSYVVDNFGSEFVPTMLPVLFRQEACCILGSLKCRPQPCPSLPGTEEGGWEAGTDYEHTRHILSVVSGDGGGRERPGQEPRGDQLRKIATPERRCQLKGEKVPCGASSLVSGQRTKAGLAAKDCKDFPLGDLYERCSRRSGGDGRPRDERGSHDQRLGCWEAQRSVSIHCRANGDNHGCCSLCCDWRHRSRSMYTLRGGVG